MKFGMDCKNFLLGRQNPSPRHRGDILDSKGWRCRFSVSNKDFIALRMAMTANLWQYRTWAHHFEIPVQDLHQAMVPVYAMLRPMSR